MPPETSLLEKLARAARRPWIWLALLLAGAAIPAVPEVVQRLRPPLPVLGTLPPFQFTDQGGKAFGSAQLQGHAFIANFIFTRCPTICPVFTEKMARAQRGTAKLGDALRLVSFSVDPEYDQPAVLLAYAEAHRADPARWSFLTGDPEQIRSTVVGGFKIAMGRSGEADDLLSIFHGTHFVLVDRQLRIRGYYAQEQDNQVELLIRDAKALAARAD